MGPGGRPDPRRSGPDRGGGPVLGHELPGRGEGVLRAHFPVRHYLYGQRAYLRGQVQVREGDVYHYARHEHPDRRRPGQGSSYLHALSELWDLGTVLTVAAWNMDYSSPAEIEEKIDNTTRFGLRLAASF